MDISGGEIESGRHFRVVELEGKKVNIGGVSITDKGSPSDAAKKLLTSLAHEKGLKKMKKLDLGKVHFSIQEYTRGSKGKIYGPYKGHFREYTAAEKKAAEYSIGNKKSVSPKMKAVIKLMKKKNDSKMNNKNKNNNK